MTKREDQIVLISDKLRRIESATASRDPLAIPKASGDMATQVCCKLLNHVYRYSLQNAENLSDIHLVDDERHVAVQIYTNATRPELQESAARLLSMDTYSKYDTFLILVTQYTPPPGIRDGFGERNLKLEILYLSDLLQVIRFLPDDTLEEIIGVLDEQLDENEPEEPIANTEFPDCLPMEELTPAMQQVLFFVSFLPKEGLRETLLRHALDHIQEKAANELLEQNWLVQNGASILRNPRLHTLELPLGEDTWLAFADFLDRIWQFEESFRWYRVPLKEHRTIFCRLAMLFQNAADQAQSKTADYARRSAEFWMKIDEYENAHQQVLRALHALNPASSDYLWLTSYLCHLIAYCYYMREQYEDAELYWRYVLDLCREIPAPISDQAVARHYVGLAYSALEEHTAAIEQYQEEIRILEPICTCGDMSFPHMGLAKAHQTLSDIYKSLEMKKEWDINNHKALRAEKANIHLSNALLDRLFDPPPKHALPGMPSASAWFHSGSRDRELRELEEKHQLSDAPLFIYGTEGVGKMEVAIQFANRISMPDRSFYLKYCADPNGGEAMRWTILQADFLNYQFVDTDSADLQREYQERMRILENEYPGTVLVIDDFNILGKSLEELLAEESCQELLSKEIRVIFVTRSNASSHNSVEIRPLGEDILMELMRGELGGKLIRDEVLLNLIRASEGDPFLLTMSANALACADGPTPEQLLNILHGANSEQESDTIRGATFFLNKMVGITGLEEDERIALCCAAILPQTGMDQNLFLECIPPKNGFSEKRLVDFGFLRRQRNLLLIHPAVRDFCLQHLVSDENIYWHFCIKLWEKCSKNRDCEAEIIRQVAETFDMAFNNLPDAGDDLPLMAALLWDRLGMYHRALRDNLRALNLWEQHYGPESLAMSKLHKSAGDACRELGMFDKAQQHYTMALKAQEVDPEDRMNQRYTVRTSLFDVAIKLGQYADALQYAQENLKEVKNRVHRHTSLATAYYNVCQAFIKLEEYEQAKENLELLLDICKSLELKDEDSLSMYYSCAAQIYNALATRENEPEYWTTALEYQSKALKIHERVLSPEHPDLATSYSNMGIICNSLADHYKALEYRLKAMAIREKVLPENHPDLASVYSLVSDSYYALGNLDHALEYRYKALRIRESVLPENHPDLVASYSIYGYTLLELGENDRARSVLETLLRILENDSNADRELYAFTNTRLGILHSELRNYEDAERYLRHALDLFRKLKEKEPDSPDLAAAYSSLGDMLFASENYPEALKYLRKALQIAKLKYSEFHPEILKLNSAISAIERDCVCCG